MRGRNSVAFFLNVSHFTFLSDGVILNEGFVEKSFWVVIAYNDEPNMRACLESLVWADELIVVDSHSTDATAEISRECTDQVYQHDFAGYGKLRNEAVAHSTHDWVFSLDKDEWATPEIRDEIRRTLEQGPKAGAYFMPTDFRGNDHDTVFGNHGTYSHVA